MIMLFSRRLPTGLSALVLVLCLGAVPVKAQFVCAGSADGNAPLSGGGANASGSSNSFACGAGADATGANGINAAIGTGANASGNNGSNTAIGNFASASGDNSSNIANGLGANASGDHSLNAAYGEEARASGNNGVNTANGFQANASGARSRNTAIGALANASGDDRGNTAIGANSRATGVDSTAIGVRASAALDNSAAFGNGATATRANQQVFGTAGNTYTMAGIASAASRAAQVGETSVVTSDGAGNLATRSVADLGFASQSDIAALNGRINDVNREARGGIALALAASGLQFDTRPGKVSLSGGYGNFKGQSGFAVGLGYAVSQALRFNAAFTAAQQGDIGIRAGASWTLN
jgi:trimeric autotransporter adhesin